MYIEIRGKTYWLFGQMSKKLHNAVNKRYERSAKILGTVSAALIIAGLMLLLYSAIFINAWYLLALFVGVILLAIAATVRSIPASHALELYRVSCGMYREVLVAASDYSYKILMTANVVKHLQKAENAEYVEAVNRYFGNHAVESVDRLLETHTLGMDIFLTRNMKTGGGTATIITGNSLSRIQHKYEATNRVIDIAEALVRGMGLSEDVHFAQLRGELLAETDQSVAREKDRAQAELNAIEAFNTSL